MSRILWCLAAGACLSSAAAAQLLAPPETSRASQRMAAYLARVAQRADPVVNIYLNRARAEGMRTLLVQPMSPVKKIQLRAAIARELIKGGLMREAIDEIGAVRRQMETSGIQPEPGLMILFPSYFYHHTIPFHTDETRISIAFDLIAA